MRSVRGPYLTFSGWSYVGSESKNERSCRSLIKSWPFGLMATGVMFWLPELVIVDGRLFFWADCCRLWVVGLFLYRVWPLSIYICSFSGGSEVKERGGDLGRAWKRGLWHHLGQF